MQAATPDVLLVDISIAEDGIESLLRLTKSGTNCKLVVLTALDDVASVSKALATGVKGYILKDISGIGARWRHSGHSRWAAFRDA